MSNMDIAGMKELFITLGRGRVTHTDVCLGEACACVKRMRMIGIGMCALVVAGGIQHGKENQHCLSAVTKP